MAGDVRALLTRLGHERFAVVGHDRGSYVAVRLTMDRPEVVTRLVLLDCVSIGEALARADAQFAQAWLHWFFFAQPDKPEQAILTDPDAWYGAGAELEARMGSQNYADWHGVVHDPAVTTAMLEDYRAGLGPDRAADETDRANGRQVACPTLLLRSARDDIQELYGDVLAVWRPWARDITGRPIDSGHHIAEEAPDALADAIAAFLRLGRRSSMGRCRCQAVVGAGQPLARPKDFERGRAGACGQSGLQIVR